MALLKWIKSSSRNDKAVVIETCWNATKRADGAVYSAPATNVVVVDESTAMYDSDDTAISINALPPSPLQNRHSKSLSVFKQFYNDKEYNQSVESVDSATVQIVLSARGGKNPRLIPHNRTTSDDSLHSASSSASSSSIYSSSSIESTSTFSSIPATTSIKLTEVHNHTGRFYYPAYTSTTPTPFFVGRRSKTHPKKTVWECPAIEIEPPAEDDIPGMIYTPSVPARTLKHSRAKVPTPAPGTQAATKPSKSKKAGTETLTQPVSLLTPDKVDETHLSVSWLDAAARTAQAEKEERVRLVKAKAAAQRASVTNVHRAPIPAYYKPPRA